MRAKKMYVCVLDQLGKVIIHKNIKATPERLKSLIESCKGGLVVWEIEKFSWNLFLPQAFPTTAMGFAPAVTNGRLLIHGSSKQLIRLLQIILKIDPVSFLKKLNSA